MNKNEQTYLWLIHNYFKHMEKCEEIVKYIFNHPELLEKKYMIDYNHEEFRFFSGKIGRLAKEKNKLYEQLTNEQKERLQQIRLMEN